jgi:apolipoprotein N-acyltransferase
VGVALIPSAGYSAAAETDKTRDFLNFLDSNPSLPNGLKIPEIGIVAWSEWPAGDLSLNTNPPWVGYFYAETHKYLVTCFSKNREEGGYPYNVAVVFDPDGSLLAQNAKRKTAPILERMSPGEADTIQTVVDTPWGRMSTLICYDTLFPEVVRREVKQGVDFIIVPANAVSPVMPRFTSMHLCQTIFRAAENHTAIAFCYSGGESALIDANGKLLVHAPFYTSKHPLMDAAVAGGLPVGTGGTLYTKIGELFIWMVLVVCLVFLAVTKIRKVW